MAGQLPPEAGRRVDVRWGIRGGTGAPRCLVERPPLRPLTGEHLLSVQRSHRRGADATQREADALAAAGLVEGEQRGDADQRVIPGPARHLHEGAARAGRQAGHPDLRQQLVGLERRGEGRGEELRAGDGAPSSPAGCDHIGAEGKHHRRQLGGGIRVGEVAPDRPAVPDRQVADEMTRLGYDGQSRAHRGVALQRVLAGEGPDGQAAVGGPHVGQLGESVDVDDDLGLREPEVHQRDETLAPGEDLGAVTVLGERGERLVLRSGSDILEASWLHGLLPGAWRGRRCCPSPRGDHAISGMMRSAKRCMRASVCSSVSPWRFTIMWRTPTSA